MSVELKLRKVGRETGILGSSFKLKLTSRNLFDARLSCLRVFGEQREKI